MSAPYFCRTCGSHSVSASPGSVYWDETNERWDLSWETPLNDLRCIPCGSKDIAPTDSEEEEQDDAHFNEFARAERMRDEMAADVSRDMGAFDNDDEELLP